MKLLIIVALLLASCSSTDEYYIPPIQNFNLAQYLGKWHEIARTDNTFERGCKNVTAEYSLRDDEGIDVINKCIKNGKSKTAKGVGYFKYSQDVGSLKVSFFRPFYGNYYIIYIDKNYSSAIVYGGSPKYIWILSRNETMTQKELEELLSRIAQFGLDPQSLQIIGSII